MKLVQDVALQKLLVRHANLDRVPGRAVFLEPAVHEGDVYGSLGVAAALVEGLGGENQRDAAHRVLRVKGRVFAERNALRG